MSSQPSSTWAVNMIRGMSDRSSEVRMKHALAGTEGHSHLVIWVNYKCCRPQEGKMSWTAVSPDTHINTHSGSQPICKVRSAEHQIPGARRGWKALHRSQVELGKSSPSQPPNSLSVSLSLWVSVSLLEPPTEIQDEVCSLDSSTVILWCSHDYSDRK